MAHFISLLPAIWPWFILIAAQIGMAAGRQRLGLTLLAVFTGSAAVLGLVTPMAVTIAAAGLLGAGGLRRLTGGTALFAHLALILWCFALGAHLIPGFHNLLILDQVQAGPESSAFTMYLNLDKPMVLFAVLLAWPGMIHDGRQFRTMPLLTGLAMLPALFILALALGAVRSEIGLPVWWLIFALSNLFLTCLTEEAFFRGYMQSALSSRIGAGLGIAAASLLFGLAHAGGGPALVVFASILGAACGLGYYATGRLWVPILMHFGFNALHLALFTYPGPA
ncbi:CAAX amino terminal protease self-immunity [Ruegeria denitrificans]|uniref:CAAX amino terminal protease self-immunity n=1 Tax=Ruegeria denitrificans TaxID=1715692 RepID=A0A0P1I9V2_9RHOB|nr:CPBP family intramembrane glutamic endopeptidase [Ruegeria denitrificans]CUK00208.1 CAAX amino terminal protease self-immunity [Ruegeria denitrificans]